MTATFARVAANILAVGLIALAAHSWPVREYLRTLVADRAGRLVGAEVSIGELKYKLSTLAFEAGNVLVSSPHTDVGGQLFVHRLAVQLSWPALLAGRFEPNQLHVGNLEASASRRDDQASTRRFACRSGGSSVAWALSTRATPSRTSGRSIWAR